ncbi:MAG: hypothetical protein KJO43_14675 [Phycisphaerae bacterium]|nr:hypothetical protein [Phycisphaerae bacterium]
MSASRPHALTWSPGAWFGAQLGGSAWMFVAAGILFFDTPWVGGVHLACFLAVNFVGLMLWRRRGRMGVYPAFQILLLTLLVGAVVAIGVTDFAGRLSRLWVTGRPDLDAWFAARRWAAYAPLLIIVALMGFFAWRHQSSRQP